VCGLKKEITTLQVQLVSAEESVAQLRAALSDREKSLNDVTKSLTSLQSILQELGEDHLREVRQFEDELRSLRAECAVCPVLDRTIQTASLLLEFRTNRR
jgi:predicted  nucleic acid-binding Zn-ribbon protein